MCPLRAPVDNFRGLIRGRRLLLAGLLTIWLRRRAIVDESKGKVLPLRFQQPLNILQDILYLGDFVLASHFFHNFPCRLGSTLLEIL